MRSRGNFTLMMGSFPFFSELLLPTPSPKRSFLRKAATASVYTTPMGMAVLADRSGSVNKSGRPGQVATIHQATPPALKSHFETAHREQRKTAEDSVSMMLPWRTSVTASAIKAIEPQLILTVPLFIGTISTAYSLCVLSHRIKRFFNELIYHSLEVTHRVFSNITRAEFS